MTNSTTFNLYTEACNLIHNLLNNYDYTCEDTSNVTLSEALDQCESARYEYEYSVYNSTLLQAMADEVSIWFEFEDICKEFDAINLLYVNEAIIRCIIDTYVNKTLDYFTK